MREQIVKDALDFLCEDYEFHYRFAQFENYLNQHLPIMTYSYYNENGCFTITEFEPRHEVTYLHLDTVDSVKEYFSWNYSKKLQREVNIFDIEPDIWNRRGKICGIPNLFFWGSDKKILKALAEVIQVQIEKNGAFFEIKV